jgi:ferrochelatase
VVHSDTPGLLLINLGTPESPRPADVRGYLREFLSDPRVIDLPAWRRWLILNLFILPFRPRRSGEAYAKIWTERGSPLLIHGRDLADKVQQRLGASAVVDLAMRYGRPSIRDALERLRRRGVRRIVVFPLYPQYSSASTGSSVEKVFVEAARLWNVPYLQVVPPFFDHPAFLDSCAEVARPVLRATRPEKVVFSFHGLPERHVLKGDPAGSHCLRRPDCCEGISAVNADCYRAQCFATARLLAERLDVAEDRRLIGFQSRLGRERWILPYTDEVIREQARRGVKRIAVASPAFVADCLETLEELGMRAAEDFRAHGGEELALVPSLNAADGWADAVVRIARQASGWIDSREAYGPRGAGTATAPARRGGE